MKLKKVLALFMATTVVVTSYAVSGLLNSDSTSSDNAEETVVDDDTYAASTMSLDLEEDDTDTETYAVSTMALDSEDEDTYAVSTMSLDLDEEDTYAISTVDDSGEEDEESAESTTTDTSTLKHFAVTLYDYDQTTFNAAMQAYETELNGGVTPDVWEGIYFSSGNPNYGLTSTTEVDKSAFVAGTYYIQNLRASDNNVGSWLVGAASEITSTSDQSNATAWTLEVNDNGTFSLKCDAGYLKIGTGESGDGLSKEKVELDIAAYSANASAVQLSQTTDSTAYYLCQWGSTTATIYGGYSENNDSGNAMLFYRVEDSVQTLTKLNTKYAYTDTPYYAAWNSWAKNSGSNANGQKVYTGLVQDTLDVNKKIVFNVPDVGIFDTSDTSFKTVYTNVEIPFILTSDGFYTTDASEHGVYFHEDTDQGSSGTAGSNTRMYFNKSTVQSFTSALADGSQTGWFPFNDTTDLSSETLNYHFGMQATVPFTINENGRSVATSDTSEPIIFSFSGDDDVWIFIDGQLVVDLGGIHNKVDATINFATGKVVYSESNSLDYDPGSYNEGDEAFPLEQDLFENLVEQDRTTFAASGVHELTIYYLERGEGSSNCRIKFNLPVVDSLTITKDATQSWSSATNEVSPLTDTEQKIVDNIDFGFTLYRSTDGGTTYARVSNTNYYLLDVNGKVLSVPSTDVNGHFTLKNGHSARFISDYMDYEDGVVYYVVEDTLDGFTEPDYNYQGEAAYRFEVLDDVEAKGTYITANDIGEQECFDGETGSYHVAVYGKEGEDDSLTVICSNFLDAELPNPSARPVEDRIVIDYGLKVEIDVLANDIYRGNSIELIQVTGPGLEIDSETGEETEDSAAVAPIYGEATIQDGKIVYSLTSPLKGVATLSYVVKVSGTNTDDTLEDCEYAVAHVYIIPATSMYYEEDFAGLVDYTKGTWSSIGTADATYQEPGVLGTLDDSPYGSDAAYLDDSGDSNGTSKYVSTADGSAQFEYTFTGTGTSFYARTCSTSGYMKVVVTDSAGNATQYYRNTIYKVTDSTLYDIPVFTYNADSYGTYTVTVTIAKGVSTSDGRVVYGSDFWLDGIKVVNPINWNVEITDPNSDAGMADSAYSADAEENMAVATLREKLLTDVTTTKDGELVWDVTDQSEGNFVLFTDIDGAMVSASDYQSYGPKEEVYLNNGQKVSFSLTNWDSEANVIYLGMKAPTGSATVLVNGHQIELANAADCYFDITNYAIITIDEKGVKTVTFTIQSEAGSLVSVTNIKVTGNAIFTIVGKTGDNSNEDAEESV